MGKNKALACCCWHREKGPYIHYIISMHSVFLKRYTRENENSGLKKTTGLQGKSGWGQGWEDQIFTIFTFTPIKVSMQVSNYSEMKIFTTRGIRMIRLATRSSWRREQLTLSLTCVPTLAVSEKKIIKWFLCLGFLFSEKEHSLSSVFSRSPSCCYFMYPFYHLYFPVVEKQSP